jgi:hypothetical protein
MATKVRSNAAVPLIRIIGKGEHKVERILSGAIVLLVAIIARAQEAPVSRGSCGVTEERGEVCQLGGLQMPPGALAKMLGPKLAVINYNIANHARLELAADTQNGIVVFLTDSRVQLQGKLQGVISGKVMSLPHGTALSIKNPEAAPVRFVLIRISG